MNTRVKVIALLLGFCCWGLACSQTAGTANQNGGAGGSGRTGGSTGSAVTGGSGGGVATGGIAGSGATGGIGAGGTTAGSGGGSGGTSLSGQGGSATGGAGTAGNGSGGSGTGGGGGSKASGTGGTSLGGSGGAGTAGSGSGGQGTGGAGSGGLGGTGTGGAGGGSSTGGKGTGGAGSGGTSGGTGTGGTATGGTTGTGGATSSPVVPTVTSSGRDSFAFGDVVFEVDPKVGARVATLSLSGANMIATIAATDTDNTTWGGVFWTSPQKAWDSNWPPPAALDSNPYTGGITTGNHLVLDSGTYTALGVSVSKDFSADAGTSWITIVYTIKATKAVQAAPWENCRVPRGGLAFFPAGASLTKGPLTMTESASIDWFDDASKTATSASGEKAIADGSGGWMAYALGGNLFLRKFTNTAASAQAPGEGQDEIYPGPGFLELEVQGPYTSIPAGGNLSWTVAWRIVKIPTSVTVSAGSTTLADFASQQAGL